MSRLGDRLSASPEDVLPAVEQTVSRALRLPVALVRLDAGPSEGGEVFDLRYRGEWVGELVVAGRPLTRADRRTLETIARQVAVAVHGVRLTHDLRSSRERLVLAREEERRRLRHDLHDELGPTLAALALELESARDVVREHPERVDATLDRAAARARDGVADVRRLVHDLRPPTLDDLGLVGALRQRAEQLSSGLQVAVEAGTLGPLPAAVEAAAYRIASEALANVARHSRARSCVVTLERTEHGLELRVRDDGVGMGTPVPGVGLRSMRERAEELGGSFSAAGNEVCARLPL